MELNSNYNNYWPAAQPQAQDTAQTFSTTFNYPPPSLTQPPPSLSQPPPALPNYTQNVNYGYYTNQSYYPSAPVPNTTTSYPDGASYPIYNGQTPAQSQFQNNSYYPSNFAQNQNSLYNWNQNYFHQEGSETDTSKWVGGNSSRSENANSKYNTISNKNSSDVKYRALNNGRQRSKSPESRHSFVHHNLRGKYDNYSARSSSRNRNRSRSRNRSHNDNRYSNRSRHRSRSRNRSRSQSRSRSRGQRISRNHYKQRSRSRDIRSYTSYSSRTNRSASKNTRRSKSRTRKRSRSQDSHFQTNRSNNQSKSKQPSERELLLAKYRRNYCLSSDDIRKKLNELENVVEQRSWIRSAPADLYYARDEKNPKITKGTEKLNYLCVRFKDSILDRAAKVRAQLPPYHPPARKTKGRVCKHKSEVCSSSSSDEDSPDEDDNAMEELMTKKQHPYRLHSEMWFNDPGEMNDGPLCRCSAKSRRSGIRHGIYAGEDALEKCDPNSNNADKLHHYRITISPPTNFLTKTPTIIDHDEHEFIFEGFSMFSHFPLIKLPTCKVIRFNIEYTIMYVPEKMPENFTIRELDYFHNYLFQEILELVDFDLHAAQDKTGCKQFHFMPRFVRDLPDNGQEILSMNEVLTYLMKSSTLLVDPNELPKLIEKPQYEWQDFADEVKGMVVTYPGKKPCSVRVDQLDRTQVNQPVGVVAYPEIVHFGIRPPQLSYAGNTDYQKAWREYVKFRHLLANMPKPTFEDKRKLEAKENKLQELRTQSKMKRDVTVDVSSAGFYRTGIMCDIVQHAMLIPVLVCHLRFHKSLAVLEQTLNYKFNNRYLLQLALTHPSYRENFGTNPDHARNSLTNCGIRQPEYGDRRIHYMNTRKRGINTLINIMSRFGAKKETESSIAHNERLEFLGDAVVEFLTSIHLFHMFPDLEEGGLATYRAAIVQNQHLAVLAKKLNLDQFMLYAHGSDLCHDLELRHAMANCFEALMGALFLDGGIEVADRIFGEALFQNEDDMLNTWANYPKHPLQEQEPLGDRQWIGNYELLQKLTKFEESIGINFTHIRLLARAFTDRSIGYTNLTLGSNQRMEFLGDTVLQLIVSEYLYKHFPEHHEGHLSLLRSSLVNNKTQAVVCDDLGMTQYAVYGNPKAELKTKDRADLLEAFLGALYVDKGLKYCAVFCNVCFFPRLQDFIMNQDWNDPKSKLQQCCLTLRSMDGGEPDIPLYKVIECKGPTNTRVYTVAVYFQGKRLAKASGHSIQEAEMNAAKEALERSQALFPQLDHQKRVIAKSMKMHNWTQSTPKSAQSSSRNKGGSSNNNSGDENRSRRSRRSRSRERNERERSSRSRDRYDSADRRLLESSSDSDTGKARSPSPINYINYADDDSSDEDYADSYKPKRTLSQTTEKLTIEETDPNVEEDGENPASKKFKTHDTNTADNDLKVAE
ncbi:hypothetical protein TKK_0003512 [Trichogramma kaykai]|uniref:Ribonuclease 3 n=1 Tax=Trichogramma kaykai TaxID=54128 RepID=A0ABD2XRV4_9HYME